MPTRIIENTAVGSLTLESEDGALVSLRFGAHGLTAGEDHLLTTAESQLLAYFRGELTAFDLPLAPHGTPFQLEVWSRVRDVPFGRTASYRDLAERIGNLQAVRAVGAANGKNPLPILIPCHRIVGHKGGLTGYSGGIERKRALLVHEGALLL